MPEPSSAAPEFSAPAADAPFSDASLAEMPPAPALTPGLSAPLEAVPEAIPSAPAPSAASPGAASTLGSAPVRAQGAETASLPIPPAAATNDPFDVVQVFYGTDRQSLEPAAESWATHLHRFLPTGGAVFVALLFSILASSLPAYRRVFSTLAACGIAAALVLGTLAGNTTIEQIRQAAKEGFRYTTERSDGGLVELGICEVTIPKTHKSGELEAPSITRLEIREDASKHVVLRKTERLQSAAFYQALRARVAQSSRQELFVFIHGFNTSFEDAARRTAQMAHDLPFEGAPIFYSWPANKMYLLTYPADETNVAWTVPHLKRFLLEIVHESDARSINLVAHSMGNRALTTALRELDLEFKGEARLFNQVVLAAPDIDAADFRDNIAPAIRNTAQRVTLYASSADQALAASQLVHRYPRAGDTQPDLVIADGLDTIDVSRVGSSPWGHSYYGASDPILHDLRMLMQDSLPPMERHWLSQADYRGRPYWIFQAETPIAARPASTTSR
jgi:esterase/lipase superfamily enzyme